MGTTAKVAVALVVVIVFVALGVLSLALTQQRNSEALQPGAGSHVAKAPGPKADHKRQATQDPVPQRCGSVVMPISQKASDWTVALFPRLSSASQTLPTFKYNRDLYEIKVDTPVGPDFLRGTIVCRQYPIAYAEQLSYSARFAQGVAYVDKTPYVALLHRGDLKCVSVNEREVLLPKMVEPVTAAALLEWRGSLLALGTTFDEEQGTTLFALRCDPGNKTSPDELKSVQPVRGPRIDALFALEDGPTGRVVAVGVTHEGDAYVWIGQDTEQKLEFTVAEPVNMSDSPAVDFAGVSCTPEVTTLFLLRQDGKIQATEISQDRGQTEQGVCYDVTAATTLYVRRKDHVLLTYTDINVVKVFAGQQYTRCGRIPGPRALSVGPDVCRLFFAATVSHGVLVLQAGADVWGKQVTLDLEDKPLPWTKLLGDVAVLRHVECNNEVVDLLVHKGDGDTFVYSWPQTVLVEYTLNDERL